jgi:uncharacterized protein YkwD
LIVVAIFTAAANSDMKKLWNQWGSCLVRPVIPVVLSLALALPVLGAVPLGGPRPGTLGLTADGPEVPGSGRVAAAVDVRTLEFWERYCFDEVNRQREVHGLPALTMDNRLREVARRYSQRMAEEGFFAHEDPQGLTLAARLREAGIRWQMTRENLLRISRCIDPIPETVGTWLQSDGHRRNLLDPETRFSAVGAWIDRSGAFYFTQIFLAP